MSDLVIELPDQYDFWGSTRRIGPVASREGRTVLWWATNTPSGAGTLRLTHASVSHVAADAWGNGAAWMLAQAPRLLGLDDRNQVETVHIPETDRGTLCVSSQVGCTLTC